MVRITRRTLLLMEWHGFETQRKDRMIGAHHWVRDYVALLKYFVQEDNIRVLKIPEDVWADKGWQKFGAVITAVISEGK